MKTAAILTLAGVLAVSSGLAASYEITRDQSHVVSAAPRGTSPTVQSDSVRQVFGDAARSGTPKPADPVRDNAAARPRVGVSQMRKQVDGHPVIYVTFDDGPSLTHTPSILDILARHHAKATFFVEGRFAHRYPQLVAAELAAGHSVGNHTWSHPHLPTLNETAVRYQLTSTRSYLRSLGANAMCVRPPFGESSAIVHRVESTMGIHEYLWTTETKDWTHSTAAVSLKRALLGLRPGAIVVFHDGQASGSAQTVAAVDEFLTRADSQGYVALALPC